MEHMAPDTALKARIEALEKNRSARPAAGGGPRRRPRHAARKARLAALVLSMIATGSLTAVFFFMEAGAKVQAAFATLPEPLTPRSSSRIAPTSVGQAATSPALVEAFNGEQIDTRYGPVQVQVQVLAETGELVEVAVLQFPNGDGTSRRINAKALPLLRSEALVAKSAQVDNISGATYTTRAYKASMQSAIDAARASDLQGGLTL